jgi:hypothetical protein
MATLLNAWKYHHAAGFVQDVLVKSFVAGDDRLEYRVGVHQALTLLFLPKKRWRDCQAA